MRIVINKKLAERNRQLATYLFLATMVALIGGFIFVNVGLFTGEVPSGLLVLAQAAVLPVALILTLTSVRMTNMWARRPYPEDAIGNNLKGVSKKSIVYHYYHGPARHILVAPQGVFAIVTRWHDGRISVEGDEWVKHQNAISKFLSSIRMDGIGNPTQDARRAVAHVEKLLQDIAPDVEVRPLVIFINPDVDLTVKEPEVPVLYADDKQKPNLTEYLRDLNREQKTDSQERVQLPLTQEQIDAFEAATLPS